jgi:predicted O-methyltransferase YrrM
VYSTFQLVSRYLVYYSKSSNGKGHGIHSPFVFDFIRNILNDKQTYPDYTVIDQLRRSLEADSRILEIEDYGAGSVDGNQRKRSVSSIAKRAAKPKKYARLLYRMVKYYSALQIIELGTSLGITTAHLAMASVHGKVITIEGDKGIAGIANHNFTSLGLKNITLYNERFEESLGRILPASENIDFAFIDGNHRFEPTCRYFLQLLAYTNHSSVMVFDDIHWSKEMELAWEEIKAHPRVMLTIDLFFIGLVFFRDEFKVKQHFSIRF